MVSCAGKHGTTVAKRFTTLVFYILRSKWTTLNMDNCRKAGYDSSILSWLAWLRCCYIRCNSRKVVYDVCILTAYQRFARLLLHNNCLFSYDCCTWWWFTVIISIVWFMYRECAQCSNSCRLFNWQDLILKSRQNFWPWPIALAYSSGLKANAIRAWHPRPWPWHPFLPRDARSAKRGIAIVSPSVRLSVTLM